MSALSGAKAPLSVVHNGPEKPPMSADFEAGQFSLAEQLVDRAPGELEMMGQLVEGQDIRHSVAEGGEQVRNLES
jgi:hypothetical protein